MSVIILADSLVQFLVVNGICVITWAIVIITSWVIVEHKIHLSGIVRSLLLIITSQTGWSTVTGSMFGSSLSIKSVHNSLPESLILFYVLPNRGKMCPECLRCGGGV